MGVRVDDSKLKVSSAYLLSQQNTAGECAAVMNDGALFGELNELKQIQVKDHAKLLMEAFVWRGELLVDFTAL